MLGPENNSILKDHHMPRTMGLHSATQTTAGAGHGDMDPEPFPGGDIPPGSGHSAGRFPGLLRACAPTTVGALMPGRLPGMQTSSSAASSSQQLQALEEQTLPSASWKPLLQSIRDECLEPLSKQLAEQLQDHHADMSRLMQTVARETEPEPRLSADLADKFQAVVAEKLEVLQKEMASLEIRLETRLEILQKSVACSAIQPDILQVEDSSPEQKTSNGIQRHMLLEPQTALPQSSSKLEEAKAVQNEPSVKQAAQDETVEKLRRSFSSERANRKVDVADVNALTQVNGWQRHDLLRQQERGSWRTKTLDALRIVSMCLVGAHCLYMGINVQVKMSRMLRGEPFPDWLQIADICFATMFTIELSLRVALSGREFCRGDDWRWNIFDVFLVASSILELMVTSLNIGFMRSLRAFRAVRVARMIRAVSFIRDLRHMVASILCCLVSLMWSVFLLTFVLFLFSVIIMQLLTSEMERWKTVPARVDDFYADLGLSMVSLFMGISGGIDWGELAQPLRMFSEVYVIIYVFYVVFVTFGVLNILTAIFVESSHTVASVDKDVAIQDHLSNKNSTIQTLRKIFSAASGDNSGVISIEQLDQELKMPETKCHLEILGLGMSEARGLFQLLDLDGSESVAIEELVVGMMRLKGGAKELDVATLMYENKRLMTRITAFMRYVEEVVVTTRLAGSTNQGLRDCPQDDGGGVQ